MLRRRLNGCRKHARNHCRFMYKPPTITIQTFGTLAKQAPVSYTLHPYSFISFSLLTLHFRLNYFLPSTFILYLFIYFSFFECYTIRPCPLFPVCITNERGRQNHTCADFIDAERDRERAQEIGGKRASENEVISLDWFRVTGEDEAAGNSGRSIYVSDSTITTMGLIFRRSRWRRRSVFIVPVF